MLLNGMFSSIQPIRMCLYIPFRHIDGHDYMYALSEMLDSAKECIFILVCFFETIAIASSRSMRCHRTGGSPLSYILGLYLKTVSASE